MVNRVSSYFPKGGHSATETELKYNMNTHKVSENHIKTTALERSVMNYWGGLKLVLRAQPYPEFLKWYKTFSRFFGSHDNPLTRQ